MTTDRLEAFSDGVLAIVITIMVWEMKLPQGQASFSDLKSIMPIFLSYVLSFIYLGIHWSNHHHMLNISKRVNGGILWANLHLLFWLSLIPFVTSWMGENIFHPAPTALYGFVLFMAGIAFLLLQGLIVRLEGNESLLGKAVGYNIKGLVSVFIYLLAILISFQYTWISYSLYVLVALMWIVPDRRIETMISSLGD